MEKELLKLVNRNKNGITKRELINYLNIDEDTLDGLIKTLENKLQIKQNRNDKYIPLENENTIAGTLVMSDKGYGFLDPFNKEKVINMKQNSKDKKNIDRIFISKKDLNDSLDGDIILVKINKLADTRLYGKVIEKIKKEKRFIGEVIKKDNKNYVKVNNKIFILEQTLGTIAGDIVSINILEEKLNNYNTCKIVKIIGNKVDPGTDILRIMEEFQIPYDINEHALVEASLIENKVTDITDRLDLRKKQIFTIDGDDAKDFDDAISLEIDGDNYILGVHIADVSNYVLENSELDKEAYKRGTSVYLADRVVPMLPHKLSDGICSLVEGEDRLTLSVFITLNKKCKIIDTYMTKSVINSKKRMTYNNVNKILNGEIIENYDEFLKTLKTMLKISLNLRKQKIQRGSVPFDTKELKLKINEKGEAVGTLTRDRGEAEKIIEDFMILANESVAAYLQGLEVPSLYRIHETPDLEKLENMNKILESIDSSLDINFRNITSKQLQQALEKYKNNDNYEVISKVVLRAMKRAQYSVFNENHFGLASLNYTHFTSPIRRYPDLTVHRILKKILTGEYDFENMKKELSKLDKIALIATISERKADECERAVNKMKSAQYMENLLKNNKNLTFEGMITWIDERGMFVTLDNQISGLIRKDSLFDFIFDEKNFTYYSDTKAYQLGDKINVDLSYACKENSTIEFTINKEKVKKI